MVKVDAWTRNGLVGLPHGGSIANCSSVKMEDYEKIFKILKKTLIFYTSRYDNVNERKLYFILYISGRHKCQNLDSILRLVPRKIPQHDLLIFLM